MKRALSLGILSLLAACSSSWTQAPAADVPYEETPRPPAVKPTEPAPPPEFTLSNAPKEVPITIDASTGSASVTAAPMATKPLTDKEVASLLSRVGDPPKDESKPFLLREGSLPPPKVGAVVLGEFPPKGSATKPQIKPETKPLEVLRYEPTGAVTPNDRVVISFTRPMVGLTTLSALSKEEVPVKISPQPKGEWRWIGTKILEFTPSEPMPKATKYTVTVPSGTKSVAGESLAKEVSFSFTTESARVDGSYPSGDEVTPGGLFFFEFNQRVDPSKIAAVTNGKMGVSKLPLRLSTPEEIAKDKIVSKLYAVAPKGTAVVFTPEKEIPLGTKVKVKVGPNIPSAEGPLTATGGQYLEFSTYGPLKLEDADCGYDGRCESYDSFEFYFNNELDVSSIDKSKVTIEPALPKAVVSVSSSGINITGNKPAGKYWVALPAGIKDVFGQEIDREIAMEFRVVNDRDGWRYRYEEVSASAGSFTVIRPEDSKRFPVRTQNVGSFRVTVYQVELKDWLQNPYLSSEDKGYPGKKVLSEVYRVKDNAKDESAVTYVDLSPALKEGTGQLLVEIEERGLFDVFKERSTSWVQVTKLGVDTFYDSAQLHAWVNNLSDGSSVEGAELTLLEMKSSYEGLKWVSKIVNKQEVKTDDSGMALLLPPSVESDRIVIVAKKGNDTVFLQDLRKVSAPQDRFLWYVTDGRRLYRPGEEVKLKGWLRYQKGGAGEPLAAASGAKKINFLVRDSRYNEITKGEMTLDETGGFSTSFKLSNTVNLGNITIVLTASESSSALNGTYNLAIEAQEYRRPEFEVKAELDPGPYFFGDKILPKVLATYFAGGGLSKATTNWSVTASSTNFVPPNQSEFSFGPGDHWSASRETRAQHSESWKAETNEDGEHLLQIAYSKDGGLYPRSLSGSVTVYDVNRQAFTGSFTTIVHPASVYVGMKTERPFAKTKEPLVVEAIAANIDGDIVEGKSISITLGRYGWSEDENKYTLMDAQACDKVSGKKAVACSFSMKKEGLYQINASVKDEKNRENRSQLYRYVVGDTGGSELIESKAEFLADKDEYAPGDTAELLLLAPFFPAEGVLRVRHGEIVDTQRFTVSGATVLLPVKIEKEMYPSLLVEVELIGSSVVDKEKIPAYASASLSLSVPAKDRKLTVEVTPKESELLPGSDTSMEIVLKDKDGKPVEGEAAIFIVDESLLALSGFTMPDPSEYFYQASYADFASYRTRERLYLPKKKEFSKEPPIDATGVTLTGGSVEEYEVDADDVKRESLVVMEKSSPRAPMKARDMVGGIMKKSKSAEYAPSPSQANDAPGSFGPPAVGAASTEGIALRSAFDSLAFFQERVKVDATGKATVKYKLQDSLTRYRIMVVAASGVQKFGTGESNITARLPLMVRPSPPRFLLQGDQAEVSVVLQNQTKDSMKVSVALRGSLTSLAKGKGYQMEIPANDRREIRFPLKALAAGSTTIQVAASDGKISDAAEVKLPIYTPATTEAFAMYGEIDEGAISQPVKVGDDVNVEFGGLQVSMSSTALASLTDAVLYLTQYPYECAEQRASRLLGILSLKDFLFEFKAEGLPSKEALNAIIEKDLAELSKLQHSSGGFGFFSSDEKPWPYTSIHVTHALIRAKQAGYKVNETTLTNAKSYIDQIRRYRLFTGRPSEDEKLSMDAYVVYVLRLFGDKDSFSENRLDDKIDTLPLEALGWIMPSLSKEKQDIAYKRLLKLVEETAGAAHFTTSYDNGAYYLLGSERRTDAILLEALIDTDPKNELIPKLVKGLMMARVKGRWASTQENMFTLLALKKYFEVYEKATPDFVARVWLGEGYAGEYSFKGRTTETYALNIPMKEVVAKKDTSIFVSKEGAGRVYYRLGLSYAPKELNVPALDSGFTVSRTYEAVDDPADVTKNKDGSWSVKAGAKVKVKVSMVAPGLRYHVALVDPMPAGFEAENPTLKTSAQNTDSDPSEWGYYGRGYTWYQHQNLRDERAEAFSMYLYEGAYSYEYFARATTPGIFIAPPAKAEEMYAPETFGRSASDKVIVVE